MKEGLQIVVDQIAKKVFGMTLSQAHEKGICISCKEEQLAWDSDAEYTDYRTTGLCKRCTFPIVNQKYYQNAIEEEIEVAVKALDADDYATVKLCLDRLKVLFRMAG